MFYDPQLGLISVQREGAEWNGSTIRWIATETGGLGGGDNADSFNQSGQIAYAFETVDGQTGVALWTPPEIDDILPGDANLDGVVNLADFGLLRANFGDDFAYLTTGDFDGDRDVDLADFGVLRANFGGTVGDLAVMDAWAATVPEPTGLLAGGALTGAVGLLRRRRWR